MARPQFHYRWFSQCAGAVGGVARERGVIKNALVSVTRSFFFMMQAAGMGTLKYFCCTFLVGFRAHVKRSGYSKPLPYYVVYA